MKIKSGARRHLFSTATTLILGLFFLVSVLLPLLFVMVNLGKADFPAIFRHPQTVPAIFNSLKVSLVATLFSIVLAFATAHRSTYCSWCRC